MKPGFLRTVPPPSTAVLVSVTVQPQGPFQASFGGVSAHALPRGPGCLGDAFFGLSPCPDQIPHSQHRVLVTATVVYVCVYAHARSPGACRPQAHMLRDAPGQTGFPQCRVFVPSRTPHTCPVPDE